MTISPVDLIKVGQKFKQNEAKSSFCHLYPYFPEIDDECCIAYASIASDTWSEKTYNLEVLQT